MGVVGYMGVAGMTTACLKESETDEDIFRKKPYRYLGYANEVGESFRHLLPRSFVTGSYGVASVYVLAHAIHKGTDKTNEHPYEAFVDTLAWQGLASVAIPGITINRICASTKWMMRGVSPLARSWGVVTVGLLSIPVIINPIDRFVDKFLNTLVRPYYSKFRIN